MQATNAKLVRVAIALARTAIAPTATDAERDTATTKLADYCAKHNLNLADICAQASQPDTGVTPLDREQRAKRAAKPAEAPTAEAPKPEAKPAKPSKPADASKAADYEARIKLIAELRASVASLYNGPSLAVRTNPKRYAFGIYADLLAAPKHRTSLDKLSVRDESGLREIILNGDRSACFDPVAINLDAGIFSRLCSVGFVEYAPEAAKLPFRLTKAGAEHARKLIKRAA